MKSTNIPGPVIAHRGASAYAPENTLLAIERVADFDCNWVELDVKLSRDLKPVIFHDDRLERVTDGFGPLVHLTRNELCTLDAGSRFSPDFKGARIPTLEEALEAVLDLKLGLVLELKPTWGWDIENAQVAMACLEKMWPSDNHHIQITSFSTLALQTALSIAPQYRYCVSTLTPPPEPKTYLQKLGCSTLHCVVPFVTSEQIETLVGNEVEFCVATVNEPDKGRSLIKLGAAGVISDFPDLLSLPNKISAANDFEAHAC